MGFRYAGQEGSLVLLNSTTGDFLLPGIPTLSIKWNFPFELNKREYLGEKGPDYREFADGFELEAEVEPDDASTFAAYVTAMRAKARGESTDQFAAQASYASPDSSILLITFPDIHWEGIPGDLGGRTDFLKSTLKGKGKDYKIQVV